MKCTTVLHGGVCHRTSTQHKCGNKPKEKKKNNSILGNVNAYTEAIEAPA